MAGIYIMPHNLKIVLTKQVSYILFTTCIKVVKAYNIIAFFY